MIKNFLAFLGGIFLLLILSGFYLFLRWQSLDHTGRQYAADSITAVFSSMDYQELKKRADARMLGTSSDDDLKAMFVTFAKLGKFQSVEDCQGRPAINLGSSQPLIAAAYACKVKFEHDTPIIQVELVGSAAHILLVNNKNSWELLGLHVASDYLAKAAKP